MAFTPDGKTLITCERERTYCRVKFWDIDTGQESGPLLNNKIPASNLAISPDGKILASGGKDTMVRLWERTSLRPRDVLPGHRNFIRYVAFSPNGRILASQSSDLVCLWELDRAQLCHSLSISASPPLLFEGTPLAFSPDSKTLAYAHGSEVVLWDVSTGAKHGALHSHTGPVLAVAFSPNGKLLASSSKDRSVRLWQLDNKNEAWAVLQGASISDRIMCLAFTPDNQALALWGSEGNVRLWDITTRRWRAILNKHQYQVQSMAFSPDGTTLATASKNGTVHLWNLIKILAQ
jgi:WD40 repeat protein